MNYRGQDNMASSIGISSLVLEPVGLLRVKPAVGSRATGNLEVKTYSVRLEGCYHLGRPEF